MKKIVSYVLVVSTQLIVGALFLLMLFSDNSKNDGVVVIENNNLDKMADSVSELFIAGEQNDVKSDESKEEEIISEEEAEKKRIEEEKAKQEALEAERIAQEQARAEEERKAEEARRAAEEAQRTTVTSSSVSDLQAYARDLVLNNYGWTEADFYALVSLWNKESGWRVNASNGSGAYGIPQALPASKMASEGSDYMTNGQTQIRWGLNYIRDRYVTPSNAWASFQAKGWY